MKIDHVDKSHQLNSNPLDKPGATGADPEFAKVLNETVGKSNANPVMPIQTAQTMQGPDLVAPPEMAAMAVSQTGDMLDALESYQHMLGTPTTSLREIEPVVNQMSREAVKMASSMAQIPDGHAVKSIMQEALIQVNQEIERFNQGVYT